MNKKRTNLERRMRSEVKFQDPPLPVRLVAYAKFCDSIDSQLHDLETRWFSSIHAGRPFLRQRPFPVKKDY
jgi:hypothetical protein